MKRLLSILFCMLLLLNISPIVQANTLPRVVDNADLLSFEEESALEVQIEDIQNHYNLDVVIVTTWDTQGKDVQTYADDYYDEHGYGYGEDATGVLLLINMGTREWYISTCGDAIYALTDYSLDTLGQELVYFLSNDNYYMGFENFVNSLPKYIIAYQDGAPVDGYVTPDEYTPEGGEEIVYYESEITHFEQFLLSFAVGFIVALVAILIMRSQMNTAKFQSSAQNYLIENSVNLHTNRDLFLYSRVSKRAKQQSSSGGGGSSVHRSSGGRSHGGRGGRF